MKTEWCDLIIWFNCWNFFSRQKKPKKRQQTSLRGTLWQVYSQTQPSSSLSSSHEPPNLRQRSCSHASTPEPEPPDPQSAQTQTHTFIVRTALPHFKKRKKTLRNNSADRLGRDKNKAWRHKDTHRRGGPNKHWHTFAYLNAAHCLVIKQKKKKSLMLPTKFLNLFAAKN